MSADAGGDSRVIQGAIPGGLGIVAMLFGLMAWLAVSGFSRSVPVIDGVPASPGIDWPDMRLDLNTANTDELAVLPQIGDPGPAVAPAR